MKAMMAREIVHEFCDYFDALPPDEKAEKMELLEDALQLMMDQESTGYLPIDVMYARLCCELLLQTEGSIFEKSANPATESEIKRDIVRFQERFDRGNDSCFSPFGLWNLLLHSLENIEDMFFDCFFLNLFISESQNTLLEPAVRHKRCFFLLNVLQNIHSKLFMEILLLIHHNDLEEFRLFQLTNAILFPEIPTANQRKEFSNFLRFLSTPPQPL